MVYVLGGWSFHLRVVAAAPDPETEDTAWLLSLALGLGLALLMVAGVPLMVRHWGMKVAVLACALAATRVVNLGAYVYAALLERQLRYGRFALVDTAAALVSFLPAFACAAAGGGAWALAAREAALALVNLCGYRTLAARRLRWRATRGATRRLLGFGAPLALMQACMSAFWSSDRLALGRGAGAAAVGAYSQARYLADAVGTMLGPLVTQVAVPVYATSGRTGVRLAGAQSSDALYALFAAIAVRAALAPALVLTLFPDLLVRMLLGPRWSRVAPLLPCFALYAALLPLMENQRARLTGLHQTHRLAVLSAVMMVAAAGAPLCAFGAPRPRTIAVVVSAGLAAVCAAGQWLVGCSLRMRRTFGPPLCAMLGALAVYRLLAGAISEPILMAAVLGAYGGLLAGLERRRLGRLWALLGDFRARRPIVEQAQLEGE
jgi:O-antigen/teichoic acid export membrane protein